MRDECTKCLKLIIGDYYECEYIGWKFCSSCGIKANFRVTHTQARADKYYDKDSRKDIQK